MWFDVVLGMCVLSDGQLQMGYPYSQSQSDVLESNMPSAVVGVGPYNLDI